MWTKQHRDTNGRPQQARYKKILRSGFKDNSDRMTYCEHAFWEEEQLTFNANDDMTHFMGLVQVAVERQVLSFSVGVYP